MANIERDIELMLLEDIQKEVMQEATTIREQVLVEGYMARDVRIGVLMAVADLVMVARRITEREEEDEDDSD